MKLTLLTLIGSVFLFACGSNTGVVPIGKDTFSIYKRGATGFVGSDSIKADVMLQASKYCGGQKKSVQVVNVITGNPPYIFGNFPKAEVQFRCVDPKDLQHLEPVEAPATQGELGEVAVSSNVTNAEVYVDGQFVGNAPLASLKLLPGTHTLEVSAKGHAPWRRELTIVQGSSTRVMAELEESPKP